MENHQKEYLATIRADLVELFEVNNKLIAHLLSKDVGKADISHLDSFPSGMDKRLELINILMNRNDGYNIFIGALKDSRQTEALRLLERIPNVSNVEEKAKTFTSHLSSQAASGTVSSKVKYPLNLDEEDVLNNVLPKVRDDLIKNMSLQETNTSIICELLSLKCFEHMTVGHVLNGTHASQRDRMNELFQIIATLKDEEILLCLERLCNLKQYPMTSAKFRKVLNQHLEGCV